jgi:hypothetical protein
MDDHTRVIRASENAARHTHTHTDRESIEGAAEEERGYATSLFLPPEDSEFEADFKCPICLDICSVPVVTSVCAHICCRMCIEKWMASRVVRGWLCWQAKTSLPFVSHRMYYDCLVVSCAPTRSRPLRFVCVCSGGGIMVGLSVPIVVRARRLGVGSW